MHVRASHDANRLVQVTKQLDGPVGIVPPGVFLKPAASAKTYPTHGRDPAHP